MKVQTNRASKAILLLISAALAAQQEPAPSASALAGLKSLPHGFYYQSAQEWKKLDTSSYAGYSSKHGASMLAGVAPSGVLVYDGPEAVNQFENRQPVFGIRVDAFRPDIPGLNVRDLLIAHMAKKKDHRELQVMKGGFATVRTGINSKDSVEVTLSNVADQTFILVPKNNLAPGEYLITFRGANGTSGYDFGVK